MSAPEPPIPDGRTGAHVPDDPSANLRKEKAHSRKRRWLPHASPDAEHKEGARGKILHFIHSKPVHYFLLALLVLDVLCVVAELALEAERECMVVVCPACVGGSAHGGEGHTGTPAVPAAGHGEPAAPAAHATPAVPAPAPAPAAHHSKKLNAMSMLADEWGYDTSKVRVQHKQAQRNAFHGRSMRILSASELTGHDGKNAEFSETCPGVGIEKEYPHHLHAFHIALRWISIAILIIFEIELLCVFIGLGFAFFKHWLYVLDFLIVTASLVLDFALSNSEGGLLILLRIWRFGRIFHGVSMSVKEVEDEHFVHNLPQNLNNQLAEMDAHEQRSHARSMAESLRLALAVAEKYSGETSPMSGGHGIEMDAGIGIGGAADHGEGRHFPQFHQQARPQHGNALHYAGGSNYGIQAAPTPHGSPYFSQLAPPAPPSQYYAHAAAPASTPT